MFKYPFSVKNDKLDGNTLSLNITRFRLPSL